MASSSDHFPIAIVQDRYGGVYSGRPWLAISRADHLENGTYRIIRCLEGEPHGDDLDAQDFWTDPPAWIAAGETPDEAVEKLKANFLVGAK
jgi:hypothetical protein